MIKYLSGIKSEKMYQYLYENKEYPFNNNFFWFKIIDISNKEENKKLLDFLEEIVHDIIFLEVDKYIIMFYFEEIDIDFRELFTSISYDFGINIKVFSSNKIKIEKKENYHLLFNTYINLLSNKSHSFYNITDLILEIIKTDINRLLVIKKAILNSVYEDSQIEKLILSMLDNDLNVTKTAKAIFMHRNTVINKLDYIKSETGLNIQNFTDALCMYWLIKIK